MEDFFEKRVPFGENFSDGQKVRFLIYAILTGVTFSWLVMTERQGIGLLIFALLQFVGLWFVVAERKKLVFLIPILFFAINGFVSANEIWRLPNLVVSVVLYGCMIADFNFRCDSPRWLGELISKVFEALENLSVPFGWISRWSGDKSALLRRIAIAFAIAVPCAVILVAALANADMVFSVQTTELLVGMVEGISFKTLFMWIGGILAGLYVFGVACGTHEERFREKEYEWERTVDILIVNIVLTVVLFVYTVFAVVQFKYLFAGSELPRGLTYTQYARKGFFELLALSCVNIGVILAVVMLTKGKKGIGGAMTKGLCHYLCTVTVVLLASSFYRMVLYTSDDGLTRLRFFVLGFLIFEAIGLLATFVYIAKPKFNITMIYAVLALSYYVILNLVPVDRIIAENQIEKYLKGERKSLDYVYTLSADVAPDLAKLQDEIEDDLETKERIEEFLKEKADEDGDWRSFNLSREKAKNVR